MLKIAPNMGGRVFVLLITTLSTFWTERNLIPEHLLFDLLGFQISRFLDFQLPRFLVWEAGFWTISGPFLAALPDLKVQEIKRTRQSP